MQEATNRGTPCREANVGQSHQWAEPGACGAGKPVEAGKAIMRELATLQEEATNGRHLHAGAIMGVGSHQWGALHMQAPVEHCMQGSCGALTCREATMGTGEANGLEPPMGETPTCRKYNVGNLHAGSHNGNHNGALTCREATNGLEAIMRALHYGSHQ
jgi:hypothetical protein